MLRMKALIEPILAALPLLLFSHFLPSSLCEKEFLNQIQEWNYRDGADKVNVQGTKSITGLLETWGNSIFWQIKFSLLNHPDTLLPELSSVKPAAKAIDNLLKQVNSMKIRLAELNQRLRGLSRTLLPIRYQALESQRLNLRRVTAQRKKLFAQRQAQRT